MHQPHLLASYAQENFGIVLMFAFGQPAAGAVVRDKFLGEWKFLNKVINETSERRADRALLEMAVQLRALDDLQELSGVYQRQKMPPLGFVMQGDGSKTDLFFRDMTNKIVHAQGFSWELQGSDGPTVVCLSQDAIRWREAHVRLEVLMHYMGGLMF